MADNIKGTYNTALSKWLADQATSTSLFQEARGPLTQAAKSFAPGGPYGAGQKFMIDKQARESLAAMNLSGVKSGMSSGSLAAGNIARVGGERQGAYLGVEDRRTEFLNQILSQLSNLMGTQAQTKAGAADPFATSYMASFDPRTSLNEQMWRDYQQRRKSGSAVFNPV